MSFKRPYHQWLWAFLSLVASVAGCTNDTCRVGCAPWSIRRSVAATRGEAPREVDLATFDSGGVGEPGAKRLLSQEDRPVVALAELQQSDRVRLASAEIDTPASEAPQTRPVQAAEAVPASNPVGVSTDSERTFYEADTHAAWGTDLACRGAWFAARSELLSAVKIAADAQDARERTTAYTQALTGALKAMEGRGTAARPKAAIDSAGAAEDLARAAANWPSAAKVYRTLGRVHELMARQRRSDISLWEARALAFYRAQFRLVPSGDAANDLGVMLARCRCLEEAKDVLEHAVTIERKPVFCRNLATVYQQLGVRASPERAREISLLSGAVAENPVGDLIEWVSPAAMSRFADQAPAAGPSVWNRFDQGEFAGRARIAPLPEYRLRADDHIDVVYRQSREVSSTPYRLTPGDEIRIQSLSKPDQLNVDRVVVQPDGMITLRLLEEIPAAGFTLRELRNDLEQRYQRFFETPTVAVTPIKLNTKVQDLIDAVERRYGVGGGQARSVVVAPDGCITLPEIGTVVAQGLTAAELGIELNERYREQLPGLGVTPVLSQRAPRYVYVLGEVTRPGRFVLEAPTTASQAVSLAGSWNMGANLRQIVVLRRGDQWQLMGCLINLHDVLYAQKPCPRQDIWLSDSDIVIVPKGNLMKADDFIDQVFTRGLYRVLPLNMTINLNKVSTI